MSPLTRDVKTPPDEFPLIDDSPADTCTHDDPEHGFITAAGAVNSFRKREAVGVVFHPYGALKFSRQIRNNGLSDQTDGVRVSERAVCRRNNAGRTNADSAIFVN